jgi:hypothetical protein
VEGGWRWLEAQVVMSWRRLAAQLDLVESCALRLAPRASFSLLLHSPFPCTYSLLPFARASRRCRLALLTLRASSQSGA